MTHGVNKKYGKKVAAIAKNCITFIDIIYGQLTF